MKCQSRRRSDAPLLCFQLFPALIVNLAALSSGMSLGYSAIALPQLKPYMDDSNATNSDSSSHYRPFVLDDESGSWIGNALPSLQNR